jgi:hypothetical protein
MRFRLNRDPLSWITSCKNTAAFVPLVVLISSYLSFGLDCQVIAISGVLGLQVL